MIKEARSVGRIISARRMGESDPATEELKNSSYRHMPQMFNPYWKKRAGQTDPVHWHEYIEFLYILEGRAEIKLGEDTVIAEPGDLVPINSGEIHLITAKESDLVYHCLTCAFGQCAELGFPADEVRLVNKIPPDSEIDRLIGGILAEHEGKAASYLPYSNALFSMFFIHLCRNYAETGTKNGATVKKAIAKSRVVKNAINYIHNNIKGALSTKDICRDTFVSSSHLCHCFKEAIGLTPVEYINKLRCEIAKSMLENGARSVGEVSRAVGFRSLSYFNRQYKKNCGVPPSAAAKKPADQSG